MSEESWHAHAVVSMLILQSYCILNQFLTVIVRYENVLTYGDCPDSSDLHHGFGSGVKTAVLDGVANGDVSIQGNGAQVHDGGRGEQHVQVDPDRAQGTG